MKHIRWVTKGVILMTLLAITTISCRKYLYLEPEDATFDQVFWKSDKNVDKALAGAYGLLRKAFRNDVSYFIFGDLVAGEFELGSDYWNFTSLVPTGRNVYSYAPYLPGTQNWTRFYELINQCHLIVENGGSIPSESYEGGQEQKNQYVGEAHFVRALAYFYMTKVWGDPILTKEALKDPTNVQPIARSPEAEVLDYCIEDLLKAATLLPADNQTSTRATRGAAWALLAHVYAWRHDYANSKAYCDSLINEGGYTLEPIDTYNEIWKGNSAENIFQVFMKVNETPIGGTNDNNNEATNNFFGNFLMTPYIQDKGPNTAWLVNTSFSDELFKRDTTDGRIGKIFEDNLFIKYSDVNYFDSDRPNDYVVDNNLVILRLADILLLRAEANLELGHSADARADLNLVRERASAAPLKASTKLDMLEILNERGRELYGEGSLGFDNIRMILTNKDYANKIPEPFTADRVAKKGYYWPLDMRTLLPQNILLTQNEWWKNH